MIFRDLIFSISYIVVPIITLPHSRPPNTQHTSSTSNKMSASPPPPAHVPTTTSSSKKSKSKKRKAEAPPEPSSAEESRPTPASNNNNSNPRKPKQKKRRKAAAADDDADADALLDLDRGVSLAVGRMDPQLLADHAAAQTRRFAPDLSPVELADLYVPAGAVADTTAFPPEKRTCEGLAEFLERYAGGDEDKRRLGSAPRACGAPHTLVVAGAGMRAADLVRCVFFFFFLFFSTSSLILRGDSFFGVFFVASERERERDMLTDGRDVDRAARKFQTKDNAVAKLVSSDPGEKERKGGGLLRW